MSYSINKWIRVSLLFVAGFGVSFSLFSMKRNSGLEVDGVKSTDTRTSQRFISARSLKSNRTGQNSAIGYVPKGLLIGKKSSEEWVDEIFEILEVRRKDMRSETNFKLRVMVESIPQEQLATVMKLFFTRLPELDGQRNLNWTYHEDIICACVAIVQRNFDGNPDLIREWVSHGKYSDEIRRAWISCQAVVNTDLDYALQLRNKILRVSFWPTIDIMLDKGIAVQLAKNRQYRRIAGMYKNRPGHPHFPENYPWSEIAQSIDIGQHQACWKECISEEEGGLERYDRVIRNALKYDRYELHSYLEEWVLRDSSGFCRWINELPAEQRGRLGMHAYVAALKYPKLELPLDGEVVKQAKKMLAGLER